MDQIKVLLVIPEFGLAGAETMCESLANELSMDSHIQVFIASLFTFHSAITDRLEQKGIKVYYLGKKRGVDLSVVFKIHKIIKDKNINVIHTHRYVMPYAIPAAILGRVKVRVHTVHSIASKELLPSQRKIAYLFYRFFSVIPVAISPQVKNTIAEEYGLPQSRIPMIFNGSDLSKCIVKTDYGIKDGVLRLLHIGRYMDVKNQELTINTISLLMLNGFHVECSFIGGGDKEEYYQNIAHKLGVNDFCHFLGLQSNVYPFLHDADVFILPSKYEGMPISLIEAMGTGLPIIASNVGGIPDMIENDESGILIEPKETDLYNAIIRLYTNNKLREKLGKGALIKAYNFSSSQMASNYKELYLRQSLSKK